jgi:hypothetical protein
MKELALSLPSFGDINSPPGLRFSGPGNSTLGFVMSEFITLLFYAGAFLTFAYLTWGVFQYIIARGEKEQLAKARQRITWSLIGFIFLIASVFIAQYTRAIFPQVDRFNRVTPITNPDKSINQDRLDRRNDTFGPGSAGGGNVE